MPRPLRITVPNLFFHVLNRGNNRQTVFRDEEDFSYFLQLLKRYKKQLKFRLYHFCLMPNHIHFVLEPTLQGSLSKIMLRLTLAYTWYFNRKYRGVGHVWQGRFKSSLLDKENYFLWCGLYVELNPVRANLATMPEDWRWSSFRFYALGKTEPLTEGLIDIDPYYLELGDTSRKRQRKYQEDVNRVMAGDFLKETRKELDGGIFGRPDFVREMKKRFEISSLNPRGRPRKEGK